MKQLLIIALLAGVDFHPFGKVANVTTAPAAREKRILLFTATWCGPCQTVKKELHSVLDKLKWQINETDTAHIQVIDSDKRPDLIAKYKIESIPYFVTTTGEEFSYPKDAKLEDRVGKVCKKFNDMYAK